MVVTGAYGWRCPCGFSTVTSRAAIAKEAAVACWDCKELHETGGNFCPSCGKPLHRLDAPGSFVEAGDPTAPVVEQGPPGPMSWERRHRCPRCGQLALTFMGVPNPM